MERAIKEITEMGKRAIRAKRDLCMVDAQARIAAMNAIADAIEENEALIIEKNNIDLARGRENNLTQALLDRLSLTHQRIVGMAQGMRNVAAQDEVINRVITDFTRPNGLHIEKISVPIGVIGIIFEARPNVTVDSAALCLKSGNVCILRGGKEAINSNTILAQIMGDSLQKNGLNPNCIQLVTDTTRDSASALMQARGYVDVLIPRGGRGLIRAVCENAKIPVIETGAGTCHTYVDRAADIDMAVSIINNAKTSRPSVCNACECMLIHKDVAEIALPAIAQKLSEHNVEIRGDEGVCAILPTARPATDDTWGAEFLDYIIAAKIVNTIDEAIDHINTYGTMHSECIVTEDMAAAERFMRLVDASCVYHNASTRYTDGGEFGFGAEIGISTQKLHARGPLGLSELTSYKYEIHGKGQVR